MAAIEVPDGAEPYILFQRTDHVRWARSLPYRVLSKLSPWSLYEPLVAVEARLRKKVVREAFAKDIEREFATFRDHLPESCEAVLDIGCGVAAFDVLLFQYYDRNPHLRFALLDKTHVEREVYYEFESRGAFYNSLVVARQLLLQNGVSSSRILLLEATPDNEIDLEIRPDLIISIASWGFHYPVSTYLERAYELLAPAGRLILDLRRETEGLELVRGRFSRVEIIYEHEKFDRVVAYK